MPRVAPESAGCNAFGGLSLLERFGAFVRALAPGSLAHERPPQAVAGRANGARATNESGQQKRRSQAVLGCGGAGGAARAEFTERWWAAHSGAPRLT